MIYSAACNALAMKIIRNYVVQYIIQLKVPSSAGNLLSQFKGLCRKSVRNHSRIDLLCPLSTIIASLICQLCHSIYFICNQGSSSCKNYCKTHMPTMSFNLL